MSFVELFLGDRSPVSDGLRAGAGPEGQGIILQPSVVYGALGVVAEEQITDSRHASKRGFFRQFCSPGDHFTL